MRDWDSKVKRWYCVLVFQRVLGNTSWRDSEEFLVQVFNDVIDYEHNGPEKSLGPPD
jgi:hypothetical protein